MNVEMGMRPRNYFSNNNCFEFSVLCLCSAVWIHAMCSCRLIFKNVNSRQLINLLKNMSGLAVLLKREVRQVVVGPVVAGGNCEIGSWRLISHY
jgi:hypothetical protein